jgi:Replication protein
MYIDRDGVIHDPSPPAPEKAKPLNPSSLAAHGLGASGLHTIGQKVARYGTAKARNREMAAFLVLKGTEAPSFTDGRRLNVLAQSLYDCGSWLELRHYLQTGNNRFRGSFCNKHLLCPVCAIRRSSKLLRRYHERCVHLAAEFDFYHVVLTVKNGPNLVERYLHLKHAFKRLRERGKKGYGVWAGISGAIWSFEFTYSQEHGWHPHAHIVVAVPKGSPPIRYGEGSQLRADWHAVTGDSFITHASPILPTEEGTAEALCEVLKYALKFSGLPLDLNLEAASTLGGKRLLGSSGVFYGLDLPPGDDLNDELEDGPFIRFMLRYAAAGYTVTESMYHAHTPQVEPHEHS